MKVGGAWKRWGSGRDGCGCDGTFSSDSEAGVGWLKEEVRARPLLLPLLVVAVACSEVVAAAVGKGLVVEVRIHDWDGSKLEAMLSRWTDWYVLVAILTVGSGG